MALTRYQHPDKPVPFSRLPAAALRAVIREGYTAADFRSDVLAGLVVGMVALPLAMALAIAVGLPPQHGLYTAIFAGFATAFFGGSRVNVTGPTAAFIVILAPIFHRQGLAGLLLSGLLGGLILLLLGVFRLGRLIEFVPHPVTTGFTAGIAVVIATLQLKDFFGLKVEGRPEHFFDYLSAYWSARSSFSPSELGVGLCTLALLLVGRKYVRRVPAPLLVLPLAALAAYLLKLDVATIETRFNGIPRILPMPIFPWDAPGAQGAEFVFSFATLKQLLPDSFAVAMLGAIESLLCAVVADGMIRTRHDPDAELIAQGIGNLICPFFSGIAATGAIARTATSIRSGARSPIASMVHALTILLAILILAPLLGYLPMASLAALLLLVAWDMSELKHFGHTLRVAPRSDVAVLLACFTLTVVFDMVVSVTVGMVLAALLFMRRMAEITEAKVQTGGGNSKFLAPCPGERSSTTSTVPCSSAPRKRRWERSPWLLKKRRSSSSAWTTCR